MPEPMGPMGMPMQPGQPIAPQTDPYIEGGGVSDPQDLAESLEPLEEVVEEKKKTDHIQDGSKRLKEEKKEQKSAQYDLSVEERAKVVAYIKKMVDDCEAGRAEWSANLSECIDLYEGIRPPKSDPWPGCSNVSTRVVATHTKLMHSKLFPAVWNDNLVHWRPMEKDDVDGAEMVGKFMGWVVRQELKMADKIDDILHDLIVNGTVALKVRWDTIYRNVRDKKNPGKYKQMARQLAIIDNVPIDDVYVPNEWHGEDDSAYIAQNIYKRIPEIKDLKNRGHFVYSKADEENIMSYVDSLLPDNIQKQRNTISGLAEYTSHVNNKPIRLIEAYIPWEIDGEMVESVFCIAYDGDAYMSGKPLTAVSPTGKRPWIIGQFIRKTGVPYGDGLPGLMKGLAEELDAIHNQRIDAGSVTISPFGFYRAASSFDPETITIGPGVFIPVDDINDAKINQFPAGGLATSFQEERIVIEYIEKLTATSAYQMGRESEVAKSRATATGTMAIISQGEQAYTLLGIRTQRIIARLLNKVLEMYQCFMPAGLVDRVLGEDDAALFPHGLSKEELLGNYDAYMTLDQTAGNKQMERQVNANLIQMAPNLLAISQDPRGYRMAEEFLKSMGKVDVERYLGPKPDPKKMQPPTAGGLGNFPVGPGQGGMGMGQ